jgi:TIR domain
MVKVFISYSWDGLVHGEWVKALANRLRMDEINVVADTTHLRPGAELPHFMETSIRDSDWVLVICTEKYKVRADARTGGVGYESRLLSGELLAFGDRKKVIPILRGADWRASAPSYLLGSTYVDLRDGPQYESEYRNLVASLNVGDLLTAAVLPTALRIREIESPSLERLRDSADTELRALEARRNSFDAARQIDHLRSRIEELERKLRRDTRDPELEQLLADLDRLDLGFIHWSGIALEEFEHVRAQPDAMLTIDFAEIHRYMHFADGGALTSFAISVLRAAGQPFYILPGTLLELRGYLESRRDLYSDRDGILRRIAIGEIGADLLLRRHAPLQRLARLLNEAIIIPWHGTMPELSEIRFLLGKLARSSPTAANYLDAMNLVMVKELRRDRPAAHVTAAPNLYRLTDEFVTVLDAESPFPLLIHPAQLALVKAANEGAFPETELPDAARTLLASAPSLLRRWTDDLRRSEPSGIEALRAFGEALEDSRDLITAFFAWIARQERADFFEEATTESASDEDFDRAYEEIVTTIDRLLTYVDSRR